MNFNWVTNRQTDLKTSYCKLVTERVALKSLTFKKIILFTLKTRKMLLCRRSELLRNIALLDILVLKANFQTFYLPHLVPIYTSKILKQFSSYWIWTTNEFLLIKSYFNAYFRLSKIHRDRTPLDRNIFFKWR